MQQDQPPGPEVVGDFSTVVPSDAVLEGVSQVIADRFATLGRQTTMSSEFEAGQAATMQYVRESRARAARVAAAMPPPTGSGSGPAPGSPKAPPPPAASSTTKP